MIMLLLTVYREPAGKKEKREFARFQEAVEFGQRTGLDYEIYDPVTGKIFDWNEINVREEDDWYYDDKEYLWKRARTDEDQDDEVSTVNFHYEMMNQNRNLQRTGS
jgi:hypothetical protein